jgi:two-component system sensor histidine kinase AtoS
VSGIAIALACLAALLGAVVVFEYRTGRGLRQRVSQLEKNASLERATQQAAECMRCLHEGVIDVSPDGKILSCNPAAEQILGAPAMELKGRFARDFYAVPTACDEFVKLAREEGRVTERPSLLKKSDGSKTLVQLSMSRVENGTDARLTQIFRDCADLQTMKERLVQNERLATVGKFASQIAHEVRNPLGSISLNLEMLEDGCKQMGGDAPQLIQSALGELDRLNAIVGEYLQFSRFPKPHPRRGRIDEVIAEVESSFTHPNGTRLITKLTSPCPDIWFDKTLIRQALDNLVRNATEAIEGEGEIRVETELIDRFITIRVSDNGRGIPPDVQPKLFEPFFTTKANGTGLGLATTQQIIFEHNGHIQVDSYPGRGSTFSIYLPR